MNKNSKIKKFFGFIFKPSYLIFGLIFLIIIISTFMQDVSVYYKLNIPIAFGIGILLIYLWKKIYEFIDKKFNKINNNKRKKIIIITFIIIGLMTLAFALLFRIPLSWDYGVIYSHAYSYVKTGNRLIYCGYPEYLQYFPNNIAAFLIEVIVLKLTSFIKFINEQRMLVLFNGLLIYLTIVFNYLFINKKFGNVKAYFSLIITLFFIPLFAYIPIFYTDTFSIMFVPLSLYIYSFIDLEKFDKKNILKEILLIIVIVLGIKIKMTILFVFIGIFIDILYNLSNKKNEYKNIIFMILLLLLLNFTWNKVFENRFQYNSYGSIPKTHWIMMGIEDPSKDNSGRNSYGGYNEEDYNITLSYNTGEESIEKHFTEIKSRISKYGVIGFIDYLNKKNTNIWGDGSYFSNIKLNRGNVNNNWMFRKLIIGKDNYKLVIHFEEAVHLAFLVIFTFSMFYEMHKKEYKNIIFHIPICFLFLFLTIWEARSRYIYNFIPFFIIIITIYIDKIKIKKIKC